MPNFPKSSSATEQPKKMSAPTAQANTSQWGIRKIFGVKSEKPAKTNDFGCKNRGPKNFRFLTPPPSQKTGPKPENSLGNHFVSQNDDFTKG